MGEFFDYPDSQGFHLSSKTQMSLKKAKISRKSREKLKNSQNSEKIEVERFKKIASKIQFLTKNQKSFKKIQKMIPDIIGNQLKLSKKIQKSGN